MANTSDMEFGQINVTVDNRSGYIVDLESVSKTAAEVLAQLDAGPGEISLVFVTPAEMAGLNLKHMGRKGITDVLAFPLDAGDKNSAGTRIGAGAVPVLLGDVVICPQAAEQQARALGASLAEEMCLLLIHGILHIAGFDHETDSGQMEARQTELVAQICR